MHKISQAIYKVRARLSDEVDVAALAKEANVSRSSFFKQFNEMTAMSPIQYQIWLRLLEARRLMIDEGETAESSAFRAAPTIGEFKNGRGEFFDQETLNGRAVLVRFVISDITKNSCHFEQAFSDDGGKTWEVNWIATDTRIKQ